MTVEPDRTLNIKAIADEDIQQQELNLKFEIKEQTLLTEPDNDYPINKDILTMKNKIIEKIYNLVNCSINECKRVNKIRFNNHIRRQISIANEALTGIAEDRTQNLTEIK